MKLSPDLLATKLESALGKGAVESHAEVLSAHSVDAREPSFVCVPEGPEALGAALRICAENEAAVLSWGGGTVMRLGNIPRQIDVVLCSKRLDKLIEHDDANLTATVQAGMPVAALQSLLGRRNQFLAIDPPIPDKASIGGSIAANSNGPRRLLYGGMRDLVIGMKIALITGEQIKAGGKVVKNVAGYDMCKLLVGSLGTLGVIVEATVRLAPIPESAATVVAAGPLREMMGLADELSRSPLLPAAVALLNVQVAKNTATAASNPMLCVWAEGFEEAVNRHLNEIQAMASNLGITTQILREASHQNLWAQIRDFAASAGGIIYRMVLPLSGIQSALETIDSWSGSATETEIIAHMGTGTVWVSLPARKESVEWFSRLTEIARDRKGYTVMAAAPAEFKAGLDVWGPPPPSLAIMREIKRHFDPKDLLNSGRFLAGV